MLENVFTSHFIVFIVLFVLFFLFSFFFVFFTVVNYFSSSCGFPSDEVVILHESHRKLCFSFTNAHGSQDTQRGARTQVRDKNNH